MAAVNGVALSEMKAVYSQVATYRLDRGKSVVGSWVPLLSSMEVLVHVLQSRGGEGCHFLIHPCSLRHDGSSPITVSIAPYILSTPGLKYRLISRLTNSIV